MKLLRTVVFLSVIVIGVHAKCSVTPKCSCPYGPDHVAVEENVPSTEVLAGAVGALSSVVVSGSALGIWHLIKSRSSNSGQFDLTEEEGQPSPEAGRRVKGPPPPYKGGDDNVEETPFKTPNIYAASKNDNINHRVGVQRNVMALHDI